MTKQNKKPKQSIWTSKSKYGTYVGSSGNSSEWRAAFSEAMGKPEAEQIIGKDSPWAILEIEIGASQEIIKKAWRKFSLKWHPDRNIGNEIAATEVFKKGLAAYTLLNGKK